MTYTVEELVINDSFIAYVTRKEPTDAAYWNDYLLRHPGELATIEEARRLVLGLRFMLQKKQNELSAHDHLPEHALYVVPDKAAPGTPAAAPARRRQWMAAAAVVLLAIAAGYFFSRSGHSPKTMPALAVTTTPAPGSLVAAQPGKHKTIVLPDSTRVTLNAGSNLLVAEGFGTRNRDLRLTGEAFFEVAHNKNLPFIVQVANYKVKAVGTKFNVKAYSNDRYSETALLEGKVQILLSKGREDIVYKTLAINQKFVFTGSDSLHNNQPPTADVVPLSYHEAAQNIETAWMSDFLIFEDQPLGEIKNILERKYDVHIVIANDEVARLSYTASFRNETIDRVLEALQLSYPFTYKKEGNTIIINK